MISQSKKFAPTVKFLTQSKVILIINLNEGNESNLLVNLFLKLSFYIDIKKIVENNHRDPFFFQIRNYGRCSVIDPRLPNSECKHTCREW